MSTPIKNGGPAFSVSSDNYPDQQGMTLRDYFAAAALQGLLAQITEAGLAQLIRNHGNDGAMKAIPNGAFKLADAMLAERERKD